MTAPQPLIVFPPGGHLTAAERDKLRADFLAAWERGKNKPLMVLPDRPPAVVWLVRDPTASEPRVAGIYPTQADADRFAAAVNREHRGFFIERWEVNGSE